MGSLLQKHNTPSAAITAHLPNSFCLQTVPPLPTNVTGPRSKLYTTPIFKNSLSVRTRRTPRNLAKNQAAPSTTSPNTLSPNPSILKTSSAPRPHPLHSSQKRVPRPQIRSNQLTTHDQAHPSSATPTPLHAPMYLPASHPNPSLNPHPNIPHLLMPPTHHLQSRFPPPARPHRAIGSTTSTSAPPANDESTQGPNAHVTAERCRTSRPRRRRAPRSL